MEISTTRVFLFSICLLALLAAMVSQVPASQTPYASEYAYRAQTITNSRSIEEIERRLTALENGGSQVAISTSTRVAVLEAHYAQIYDQISDVRRLLYTSIGFIVVQISGLAWIAIKARKIGT